MIYTALTTWLTRIMCALVLSVSNKHIGHISIIVCVRASVNLSSLQALVQELLVSVGVQDHVAKSRWQSIHSRILAAFRKQLLYVTQMVSHQTMMRKPRHNPAKEACVVSLCGLVHVSIHRRSVGGRRRSGLSPPISPRRTLASSSKRLRLLAGRVRTL